jgi:metal-responsive CopG/Arc/MetJ family transcriptional regulator
VFEKMVNKIKVNVTLNVDVLEALDAVAKKEMVSRSAYIQKCVRNDPDVYDVLEGMKQ